MPQDTPLFKNKTGKLPVSFPAKSVGFRGPAADGGLSDGEDIGAGSKGHRAHPGAHAQLHHHAVILKKLFHGARSSP